MARFSYGYFGAPMPPGYRPIGPQTVIGQAGPAGGTVVSITPGPVLTRAPVPVAPAPAPAPVRAPVATTAPIFFRPAPAPMPAPAPATAPMPAPRPVPPPAPVPAADTGKSTIISTPVGPVQVKVVTAPVPAPMLLSPGPTKPPVMVVPTGSALSPAPPPVKSSLVPAPSNLPTQPVRVQPKAPRLVDEDTDGLPPGTYDASEFFPPEIFPRIPPRAGRVDPRARRAVTATADEEFDVEDIFIGGGRADEEGRAFPMTRPAQTAARSPSPTGYMPVAPVVPRVVDAKAETDGTVLVRVPGARGTPVIPVVPKGPAVAAVAAGGAGLVGVAAGAGAGFLVAGPVGAGVGAVAVLLLGGRK